MPGRGLKGSSYTSVFTFSTSDTFTQALFEETINEKRVSTDGYTETLSAFYEGTAIFERNTADNSLKRLLSAKFDQQHNEWNSATQKTNLANGLVTMSEKDLKSGYLSFDGTYYFYIRSYETVTGKVSLANATYEKGYSLKDMSYFNNNNLTTSAILFNSSSDYTDYKVITNPSG